MKSSARIMSMLYVPIALSIGAFVIASWLPSFMREPVLLALLLGFGLRRFLRAQESDQYVIRPSHIAHILIPIGIFFYAARNVRYSGLVQSDVNTLCILVIVAVAYFLSVLALGKIFGIPRKIRYLVATGSAVCGISAIVMTSDALDADAEEISVSVIAVSLIGMYGLFVLLPFTSALFSLLPEAFAYLAGSTLQLTGLVRVIPSVVPHLTGGLSIAELALGIKSIRYLFLIICIPLCASLLARKIHLPSALWVYIIGGILGSLVAGIDMANVYASEWSTFLSVAYTIAWGAVMAAIGVSTDVSALLSRSGFWALLVAGFSMCIAILTFIVSGLLLGVIA
ncbi:MAG: putative sulfate exporter family transporter [Nanoarchaeota archaeon]